MELDLDKIKAILENTTAYKLSQLTGFSQSHIGRFKNGRSILDSSTKLVLALNLADKDEQELKELIEELINEDKLNYDKQIEFLKSEFGDDFNENDPQSFDSCFQSLAVPGLIQFVLNSYE
ncbi:hypothetical protein [Ligilactobacillus agilis]|uniref:hypothetical protein n=1 Tax=Ligilactobacillus agilis TaxID=1601 RepID=UPI00067EBE83|nr:hypothetical protein [Ligilactobacillus agilis]